MDRIATLFVLVLFLALELVNYVYKDTVMSARPSVELVHRRSAVCCRIWSYRMMVFNRTCVPFAQSSGAQYSLGLCETPLRHGTKIIEVGHRLLVCTLSWPVEHLSILCSPLKLRKMLPAPDVIFCTSSDDCCPNTSPALFLTHSMHPVSNLVAELVESNLHSTVQGRPRILPPSKPSKRASWTSFPKLDFRISSIFKRVSSCAARISRLN